MENQELFISHAVIVSLIYIPIMYLILKNRKKQAVYIKSPHLILLGSFGLFLDSILNIIIYFINDDDYICFLSIFCTMTVHYIGFFSIIFRANRIFKVMKLESVYLKQIYQLAGVFEADQMTQNEKSNYKKSPNLMKEESVDSSSLLFDRTKTFNIDDKIDRAQKELQDQNQKLQKQIDACKERKYIKVIFFAVFVFFIFGIIAFFDKYIFMFVPIFRSDSCFKKFEISTSQPEYQLIQSFTIVSFSAINLLELIYLIYSWIKLRSINQNQLNIKNEIRLINIIWISFSITYLTIQIIARYQYNDNYKKVCFYLILVKNVCTFCIQTVYTLYQSYFVTQIDYHSNHLTQKLQNLDLDVILTHQFTFNKFKHYIETNLEGQEVYLNLYCQIQLYDQKLQTLLAFHQQIESNGSISNHNKQIVDNQTSLTTNNQLSNINLLMNNKEMIQILLGQKMIQILKSIKDNYQNHFKNLKIQEYENLIYEKRIVSEKNNQIEIQGDQIQEESESIRINSIADQSDHFNKKNSEAFSQRIQKQSVFIIYELSWLDQFQNLIEIKNDIYQEQMLEAIQPDQILRLPLSFKVFLDHCKNQLNLIFINKFKKDIEFKQLLMEICEVQTKADFLEKANFLVKKQQTDK